MKRDIKKSIFWLVLSSAGFAMMNICAKLCGNDMPAFEKVCFRCFFMCLVSIPFLKERKVPFFGTKSQQKYLIPRALCGLLSEWFSYKALMSGSQADVTVLIKLSPFYITALAIVILKEKVNLTQVISLFIAFGGAVVVASPKMGIAMSSSVVNAILSGLFAAIGYFFINVMSGEVDSFTIITHYGFFGGLFCLLMSLKDFVVPDVSNILFAIGLCLFGFLGQIGITLGYQYAEASKVSVFTFLGIVFSAIFGFLFLNEVITTKTVIGGLMVIIAGVLSYWSINRKSPAIKKEG